MADKFEEAGVLREKAEIGLRELVQAIERLPQDERDLMQRDLQESLDRDLGRAHQLLVEVDALERRTRRLTLASNIMIGVMIVVAAATVWDNPTATATVLFALVGAAGSVGVVLRTVIDAKTKRLREEVNKLISMLRQFVRKGEQRSQGLS